MTHRKQQK